MKKVILTTIKVILIVGTIAWIGLMVKSVNDVRAYGETTEVTK